MHGRDVAFGAWRSWVLGIAMVSGPGLLAAQTGPGPFARMVLLRAREGMSAQFEADISVILSGIGRTGTRGHGTDGRSFSGSGSIGSWTGHSATRRGVWTAPSHRPLTGGTPTPTSPRTPTSCRMGSTSSSRTFRMGLPSHRRLRCWSSRLTTSSRAPVRRSSKGSGHGRVMVRRVTGFGSSRAGRYRVTCASDRDRISPPSRRAPRWKPYHQPAWPASCASQWRCCDSDRT